MREAPSVTLIQQLLKGGAKVHAYDPVSKHEAKKIFENRIELADDAYDAVKGADGLAIVTEWNEFKNPDFALLKNTLKSKAIFDGRNLYNPESLQKQGLAYYCIGKADPK
jgi:UDPglucose 6-dehydrogenase